MVASLIPEQVEQSIAAVLEFYDREEQKMSRTQRAMERISHFIGRPVFLAGALSFVALWMGSNTLLPTLGKPAFDPPPYAALQGIIGFSALLTSTVVLARQNRLGKLSEHRAHLDLKVSLLTELKAAKLIDLLEELRRDLPNVRDRHDSHAAAMKDPIHADLVASTLDPSGEEDEKA